MATHYDSQIQNAVQEDNSQTSLSRVTSYKNTPLLGKRSQGWFRKLKKKFKGQCCCLSLSKAAELSIIWNLIVSFGLMSFLDPSFYTNFFVGNDSHTLISSAGIA